MKKLSPAQQHVVDRMKEGWELGLSRGFHVWAWLQQDGLGRGGDIETVSIATLFALLKARTIVQAGEETWSTIAYKLSEEV